MTAAQEAAVQNITHQPFTYETDVQIGDDENVLVTAFSMPDGGYRRCWQIAPDGQTTYSEDGPFISDAMMDRVTRNE